MYMCVTVDCTTMCVQLYVCRVVLGMSADKDVSAVVRAILSSSLLPSPAHIHCVAVSLSVLQQSDMRVCDCGERCLNNG